MKRSIPNLLTVGRVGLAGVFFVLLGLYDAADEGGRWLLNAALVLYLVAGATDVLDGWLARRWNAASTFGRMIDPIVDKVLIVGAFVMLAGPNFVTTWFCTCDMPFVRPVWFTGGYVSGVWPWMVVVMLAREFIVSGVRGYSESRGVLFPATPAGKIKMFVQSAAICAVLFQAANLCELRWAILTRAAIVWLAVIVTVLSGFMYIGRARRLLRGDPRSGDERPA